MTSDADSVSGRSELRCPLCQADTGFRFIERAGEYVLFHCPCCDLVFSNPMKGLPSDWYDRMYVVRHIAIDDRIRWYYSWAVKNLPRKGKLLDVGCGEGTFVAYADKHGFEASGLDFSAAAIEAGTRRFGLTSLVAATVEDYRRTHSENAFDVITLFEILEHTESPVRFLEEIQTLLRPGGLLIVSVPNRARWPILDFVDYPPHHLTRWSSPSLRTILETSGFEIVRSDYTPVRLSINYFFGYFFRILLYKALDMHAKGFSGTSEWTAKPHAAWLKKYGGLGSKLRKARDVLMWIPTLAFGLFLYPFFEGYNILAIARKRA